MKTTGHKAVKLLNYLKSFTLSKPFVATRQLSPVNKYKKTQSALSKYLKELMKAFNQIDEHRNLIDIDLQFIR